MLLWSLALFVCILGVPATAESRECTTDCVLIIGGMNEAVLNGAASESDIFTDVEVYPESCRPPVPDLPVLNSVTGSYKGRLVSCGGANMTSPESGTLVLDCFILSQDNTWDSMAPLNMARTQFYSVLVEVGQYLVAIFTPYDGLTTMEVYDGESWSLRPDLESGLSDFPETVDLTTGQFVATGDTELSYVKNNFIFSLDINTGTWSRQDMEAPDGDDETMFQAKVHRINYDILNGILRTGGTNFAKSTNVSTFISFDNDSGEWESFPPLTTPRFAHAMVGINQTVMVFGGAEYDMGQVLPAYRSTEVLAGGRWVKSQPMKKGRLGHKVIVIPCDN